MCVSHIRKVRNVGKDVQRRRDPESKRSSDLKRSYGVLDIVEDVIHVLPSAIGEENFEHCSCILYKRQRNIE